MKKYNKIIATLAIITTMTASIAGISAFAGTNNSNSGSNYEVDFDFDAESETVYTINLTNTHNTSLVDIEGTKTWVDNDNQDGLRPDSIVIHLYANGEDTGLTSTASEETNWTYEFKDMAEFENGIAIEYSVKEDVPSGYTVKYITE